MSRKRTIENELNFRNAVRSRDDWTCQKCGSAEYPQAHHIEPGNNNPENGITLCVYCHADEHPDTPRELFIANTVKTEKDGCISAGELAKELHVHPRAIVRRARKLGILKPAQKWLFTLDELALLRKTIKCKKRFLNSQVQRKIFQLSDIQIQQLKRVSEIIGYSESEIIRRAFDEYVERRFPNVSQYQNKSAS